MIEKKFVDQKMKEFMIQERISSNLKNVGFSGAQLKRTPLGEKIIISAARPGFVVGRKGENIKAITADLKGHFELENPQIEINEVEKINLDAQIIAERIASSLERFGTARFKGIGHKVMEDVMQAGALGVEVLISGKIPGARAKRWRFYNGYLKKCGDIAVEGVRKSIVNAKLKTGIIGIQVKIMPPDIVLPDNIRVLNEMEVQESVEDAAKAEEKTEKKPAKKKAATKKKKAVKKKAASKKEASKESTEEKTE